MMSWLNVFIKKNTNNNHNENIYIFQQGKMYKLLIETMTEKNTIKLKHLPKSILTFHENLCNYIFADC